MAQGSGKWWLGFGCGFLVATALYLLLLWLVPLLPRPTLDPVFGANFMAGAWSAGAARAFTVLNLGVFGAPFLIGCCRPRSFAAAFAFCRRLPTMVGMLGTLWALIASNMNEPGTLAEKFSVAIVSTFVGIVVQIALELFGRLGLARTGETAEDAVDGED